MKEEWKDIPGYEGYYQVSDRGRVRSLDRIIPRSDGGKSRFMPGKVLRHWLSRKGYVNISLCKFGITKYYQVHSIVAKIFLGPYPKGFEVNHINGKKADNRAKNLEYVTRKGNIRHAMEILGVTMAHCGEANGNSKLTDKEVSEIKRLAELPKEIRPYHKDIAKRFGVCRTTVQSILYGRGWIHVD